MIGPIDWWLRRQQRRATELRGLPEGYRIYRDGRWWRACFTVSYMTLPIEPISDFNKWQAMEAAWRHYERKARERG